MKIGLIDVDGHNYPNLALMKLSAWHKKQGDEVEWWWGWSQYDVVYMSKIFDDSYSQDISEPVNAELIIKGGTGYSLSKNLPEKIEHMCPDYSIYPTLTKNTAYGFLTRGCPRACPFCIVSAKEGRKSVRVADLSEWWRGQKNIKLMDPNILACDEYENLLNQIEKSKAQVDINQGLDARLLTKDIVSRLNSINLKSVHFAWDLMSQSEAVLTGLELYRKYGNLSERKTAVYVLTNFNTTLEEDLYRVYKLREMGLTPYIMIYDKPSAPKEVRRLQRWVNNRFIFRSCDKFEDYNG